MKFAVISNKTIQIPSPDSENYLSNPTNPVVTYPAGTILAFVDQIIVQVSDDKQVGDSI